MVYGYALFTFRKSRGFYIEIGWLAADDSTAEHTSADLMVDIQRGNEDERASPTL